MVSLFLFQKWMGKHALQVGYFLIRFVTFTSNNVYSAVWNHSAQESALVPQGDTPDFIAKAGRISG